MKLLRMTSAAKEVAFFSFASLLNTYSMSLVLILYGIAGDQKIAADIGIVQAATFALFYSFSANARSLLLSEEGFASASLLLRTRLILVVPLSVLSWLLTVPLGQVNELLVALLILRRITEWFGEIGLAVHERRSEAKYAKFSILCELVSILLVLVFMLIGEDGINAWIPILLWALSPVVALRRVSIKRTEIVELSIKKLLPHFGSTVIVGLGVYVFRILLLILVGKPVSGSLFTAFAIGGIIPTILGQGIAPALTSRYKTTVWLGRLLFIPAALMIIGLCFVSVANLNLYSVNDRAYFYIATGWSIAGGGIMFVATALKARLIQRYDSRDIFGSDLISNLLIMTSVPFVFYFLGPIWFSGLYFFNACINLCFVFFSGPARRNVTSWHGWLAFVLGFCLVLPLFFQLKGTLFSDNAVIFEHGKNLSSLPLPISIGAIFIGIAAIGNYRSAIDSIYFLFATAILFILSMFIMLNGDMALLENKILVFGQYILPMFGLVLGEMYGDLSRKPLFERSALVMLLLILPAQLIATWMLGYTLPQPNVLFFSIYQHLQYFPMVVTALVIMVSFGLWKESSFYRLCLGVCIPIAMIYTISTLSMGAIVGLCCGLVCFGAWYWVKGIEKKYLIVVIGITLSASIFYIWITYTGQLSKWIHPIDNPRNEMTFATKFTPLSSTSASLPLPIGIHDRQIIWKGYLEEIIEPDSALIFGHADYHASINKYPSAHSYWLDLLYNFGIIGLLPLITLVMRTATLAVKARRKILTDPFVLGALLASAYLIVFESFFKVGMKQPYPGILTFFVWGLLLVRMRNLRQNQQ